MGALVALAAALAWAGLDALRKHLSTRVPALALALALMLGQVPIFAVMAAVDGGAMRSSAYLVPGSLVALTNAAASLLFLGSVRRAPLSVTIPLLSLTPVLSALIAWPLLGEVPTARASLGIGLVVGGALLLSLARRAERGRDVRLGALMMVGVATLWSLTGALDKLALRSADISFHATYQMALGALALAGVLALRRQLGDLAAIGRARLALAAAIALLAAAVVLQLLAFTLAQVAFVETLKRGVGMAMAVILGRVIFREPLSVGNLAAIAVMFAGTALLVTD